ncbi:MAG: TonB-dependent receptor [Gemmatimonadaceae bacterium]|nr:TonB-dependent receptor [Gemmatimonadaceae bacterium]
MRQMRPLLRLAAAVALLLPLRLAAQGVTTSTLAGSVVGPAGPIAGARVTAVHQPSGSSYRGTTRADGRYTIPGMRVGGPYTVSATYIGYERRSVGDVMLSLGVTSDVPFVLTRAAVTLGEVTVTASGGVISANRTGAATTVPRQAIEALPTISRTIGDFTRLTPQSSGSSFAGQDNRLNNITVDGSYFNNSFGLSGQPGGRTGVAPIPLDAVDQIQVAIAPFDVRQGNFVGAGVNAVTKSGTNEFEGSVYYLGRNEQFNGTQAGENTLIRTPSKFAQFGVRVGGPIIHNKLFFFTNFEDDKLVAPGSNFLANKGSEPITGNTTRVLESDLTTLSAFLKSKFDYETGDFTPSNLETPSRRLIAKLDYNASESHKFSLRYIGLDSKTDVLTSTSSSLGNGFRRSNTTSLTFANSNYAILENIHSLVGEWNAQLGPNMSNNLIVGYTTNDESRQPKGAFFPLIDILKDGITYTSVGFEPFTPANQLYYNTGQITNNFTIFTSKHDLTFGATAQHYRSTNVFFPGSQSVYVYNSLADFYTDANAYLANPKATTSAVTLNKFQVRYNNIPGQVEPVQPLDVIYAGAYAQDEWRVRDNLKLTLGLRLDVPKFKNTAIANPEVDGFTFRDENGAAVKYSTAKLPDANVLFSPRLGMNWDVRGDRTTQVRGGTGVFTGSPAYVWISNQVGANGVLTGFDQLTNTKTRPFNPNPDAYKQTNVTGAPAASYELAFTNPDYRFPQVWRSNIAVDQKLPYDIVGTAEALYGKDVNGAYYINANLAAPIGNFTGADSRPRYGVGVANRVVPKITSAIVLKNQNVGYSYSLSGSLEKSFSNGFFAKAAYNYGVARNTVDPGSIALGSWNTNEISGDPNNPGVGYSSNSPGHRSFLAMSYRREYFRFGATSISLFAERRTQGNTSYLFASDINGDGGTNDLIYIPRDQSEMNFVPFSVTTAGVTRTFTAAEQAVAFDAYINQDEYLSTHRGEYAGRGAVFLPQIVRADVSIAQDIFRTVGGRRNTLQVRLDILNAGNLINKNFGVGSRLVSNQPLTNGAASTTGALQYRLRNVGNELISTTYQKNAGIADVYRMQLGLRYNFN